VKHHCNQSCGNCELHLDCGDPYCALSLRDVEVSMVSSNRVRVRTTVHYEQFPGSSGCDHDAARALASSSSCSFVEVLEGERVVKP
jgi:hypothetical protein